MSPGAGGDKVLTARQRTVLEAFRRLTAARGAAPSVRELGAALRIQVSAAHRHLKTLVTKGVLETRGRFVRLPGADFVPVPILGRVPAGPPREALEAPDGYLPCPAEWGRGKDLFALRVRGDSMVGVGILDSDVVVCARTETARDDEIVVAMVNGEATVKRLERNGASAQLVPANARHRSIPVRGDVRIIAKVLGVFRSLA